MILDKPLLLRLTSCVLWGISGALTMVGVAGFIVGLLSLISAALFFAAIVWEKLKLC